MLSKRQCTHARKPDAGAYLYGWVMTLQTNILFWRSPIDRLELRTAVHAAIFIGGSRTVHPQEAAAAVVLWRINSSSYLVPQATAGRMYVVPGTISLFRGTEDHSTFPAQPAGGVILGDLLLSGRAVITPGGVFPSPLRAVITPGGVFPSPFRYMPLTRLPSFLPRIRGIRHSIPARQLS